MANTTNFGWETPDDTDLVKDGAAAMRTLGNAIDTSLVDLKGGTTGQVLSKTSNTDMDFTWVTTDDTNAIQNAIVDAKGDLIAASAADTPARLAVGNNGETLVADSSASTGLKWSKSLNLNQLSINSSRTTEKLVISAPGSGTDGCYFNIEEATATSRIYINFLRATGTVGNISGTNTAVAYNTTSDYRLKENIEPINNALEKLDKLKPVKFNFKSEPSEKIDGFLAHQVQEVIPNAVSGEKDAVDENGNPLYQGVDYSKLVPILVAAVQELSLKVQELEIKLNGTL